MKNFLTRCLAYSLRVFFLGLIWMYQRVLSEGFKFIIGGTCHACRFYPTCSEYAREAFTIYPPLQGLWYSLRRLGKCHPFHQGGLDLLPKKNLD